MQDRRAGWLRNNGPCNKCGSEESLEVDHVDPNQKVHHAVWSWSLPRMLQELRKCQVLCRDCHKLKSAEESRQRNTGVPKVECRVLTPEQVHLVRECAQSGLTQRAIAEKLRIGKTTVQSLLAGKYYNDIEV